uniref:Uncharacterized protein n=2 Tax=Aegilops tauschii subsp. strangulata TaxID=200361 RepID=A0A453AKL1_AEGTS
VNGFDALSEYDAGVTEIDEEDEKALAAFMSKETSSKRSLGDIILQKIREKDATISTYSLQLHAPELFAEGGELAFSTSRGRLSSLDSTRRGPGLLHVSCKKGDRRGLPQAGGCRVLQPLGGGLRHEVRRLRHADDHPGDCEL